MFAIHTLLRLLLLSTSASIICKADNHYSSPSPWPILATEPADHSFVAVAGGRIVLPCNTSITSDDAFTEDSLAARDTNGYREPPKKKQAGKEAAVSLILWYKGATGAPIYSVDGRNVPLGEATHQRGDKRYQMQVLTHPPLLRIDPVRVDDEGEFRCRVDYSGTRTKNFVTHLRVIGEFISLVQSLRVSVRFETQLQSNRILHATTRCRYIVELSDQYTHTVLS